MLLDSCLFHVLNYPGRVRIKWSTLAALAASTIFFVSRLITKGRFSLIVPSKAKHPEAPYQIVCGNPGETDDEYHDHRPK